MGVAGSTVCRRLFATGSRRGAYDPYRTTQHDSTRLNGRERDAHDVAACIHRVGSASVIPVKPGKTTRSPHGPTVIATLRGRDTAMHLPTIRPGSLIPAAAPGDHPTAVARIALASQRLSALRFVNTAVPRSVDPAIVAVMYGLHAVGYQSGGSIWNSTSRADGYARGVDRTGCKPAVASKLRQEGRDVAAMPLASAACASDGLSTPVGAMVVSTHALRAATARGVHARRRGRMGAVGGRAHACVSGTGRAARDACGPRGRALSTRGRNVRGIR